MFNNPVRRVADALYKRPDIILSITLALIGIDGITFLIVKHAAALPDIHTFHNLALTTLFVNFFSMAVFVVGHFFAEDNRVWPAMISLSLAEIGAIRTMTAFVYWQVPPEVAGIMTTTLWIGVITITLISAKIWFSRQDRLLKEMRKQLERFRREYSQVEPELSESERHFQYLLDALDLQKPDFTQYDFSALHGEVSALEVNLDRLVDAAPTNGIRELYVKYKEGVAKVARLLDDCKKRRAAGEEHDKLKNRVGDARSHLARTAEDFIKGVDKILDASKEKDTAP